MSYFLDSGIANQSSPDFFRRTRPEESFSITKKVFPILDILTRSGDIRDQSRKLCKMDPNFTEGKFLEEGPEFLDLHYNFGADIGHVVKFQGDRPRELGAFPVAK